MLCAYHWQGRIACYLFSIVWPEEQLAPWPIPAPSCCCSNFKRLFHGRKRRMTWPLASFTDQYQRLVQPRALFRCQIQDCDRLNQELCFSVRFVVLRQSRVTCFGRRVLQFVLKSIARFLHIACSLRWRTLCAHISTCVSKKLSVPLRMCASALRPCTTAGYTLADVLVNPCTLANGFAPPVDRFQRTHS